MVSKCKITSIILHNFPHISMLRISMNMKDANTGEEIWRSSHWDAVTMFDEEIQGKLMLLTFFVNVY